MMKKVSPHEYFRLEFKQILQEGKRQEKINKANKGESALAKTIHRYFTHAVIPIIIQNDWVYEAATKFAEEYAPDCFRYLRVGATEAYTRQMQLHEVNNKVENFWARAAIAGASPLAGEIDLIKASDFMNFVEFEKLSTEMQQEAKKLYELAKDQEEAQTYTTLRILRDAYEILLPRVMYVVKRVIKVGQALSQTASDGTLLSISDDLSWYETRIAANHPLYSIFGNLRDFYKIARNVGSHHDGYQWRPEKDEVLLRDTNIARTIHVYEFQQRYRYLVVYLCDYGMRGILSAFCERERGQISNKLVQNYAKVFPEGFPAGRQGIIKLYP